MPRDDTMRGLAHERDHLRARAEAAERALAEERAHADALAEALEAERRGRGESPLVTPALDAHRARRGQKPGESAHVDGTRAGDAHDERARIVADLRDAGDIRVPVGDHTDDAAVVPRWCVQAIAVAEGADGDLGAPRAARGAGAQALKAGREQGGRPMTLKTIATRIYAARRTIEARGGGT